MTFVSAENSFFFSKQMIKNSVERSVKKQTIRPRVCRRRWRLSGSVPLVFSVNLFRGEGFIETSIILRWQWLKERRETTKTQWTLSSGRCGVQWHADAICQSLHRGLLYENYPAGTWPIKRPRKSFAAVETNIKFTAAAACDTLCSPLFSFSERCPEKVHAIDCRKENSLFVKF